MAFEEELQSLLAPDRPLDATLLKELRDCAERTAGNRDRLDSLLVYITGHLTTSRVPERALYLRGAALEQKDEPLSSQQAYLLCCERLLAIKNFVALRDAARRALSLSDSPAAARYALKASETLFPKEKDAQDLRESLEAAHRLIPDDPEIAFRLAGRIEETEGLQPAIVLYTEALEGYVRRKKFEEAEEAFLKVLEGNDRPSAERALAASASVARSGDPARAATLLELALGRVREAGLGPALLAAIRALASGRTNLAPLRPVVLSALEILHGGKPHHEPLVKASGFDNPEVPLADAFARMDSVLAYPPGRYVIHARLGVGLVQSNDAASVIVDFPQKSGHRMALDMAKRSLTLLREEDLRAIRAADPGLLPRLAQEDPAGLLLFALRHVGGEADQKTLKKLLVDQGAVSLGSWTTWWKKAKDAARKDPRLDGRDAYRDIVRLLPPGAHAPAESATRGEAPARPLPAAATEHFRLPDLKRNQRISTGVGLLRRLLKEHPGAEEEARRKFSSLLQEWLGRKARPLRERAAVLPYLLRWEPDRRAEWARILAGAIDDGLDLNDYPSREEQEDLLGLALETSSWEQATLHALNSRYPALRDRALEIALQRTGGGDAGTQILGKALHADMSRALFHLSDWHERLQGQGDAALLHPWRLFAALLNTLSTMPSQKTIEEILNVLRPGGVLLRRAGEFPCPIPLVSSIMLAGRSLRFEVEIFPKVIDFLKAAGLRAAETLEAESYLYAAKRRAAAEEEAAAAEAQAGVAPLAVGIFGGGAESLPAGTAVMTRKTYQRLQADLRRLADELRTVIPEAIRRAREHGDLSENFEYKSAKERQAYTDARASQLKDMLSHVKFVEDLEFVEGVAGPATEVDLVPLEVGDRRSIWILGDNDDPLGENVISLRSPMAQTLMGHRVGDEVALLRGGVAVRYRLGSVRRRLPEGDPATVDETLPEIVHGEE